MTASGRRNPAGRPLRRDAQRNRERILAAARQLFAERGTDASLDDVAARAGVGVGTVYRRYHSKSALIEELIEERIDELVALAETSLFDADPWQAFVSFLERVMEIFAADRTLAHLVARSDRARQGIAVARARLEAPVAALVARAKADGRLRPDFADADVAMVHAMLAAVVAETPATAPDLWRRYLVMLVDGLVTARSAPSVLPVPET
ncbi:MAG: TetR/AcrR family transcriptional regulator [Frankiaceae bacterium]